MGSEKEERFRGFFKQMDTSGNGSLTIEELFIGLRDQCGCKLSVDEVAEMFCGTDSNKDSQVSEEEFIDNCCKKLPKKEAIKANLNLMFKKTDADCSGFLESDEVRGLFGSMDCDVTEDEIEEYISAADVNGDGKISLDELNKHLSQ